MGAPIEEVHRYNLLKKKFWLATKTIRLLSFVTWEVKILSRNTEL